MARAQVSKKLRFDVLERDGFRCRYCGAEPDDGALHVDHIIPVAEGGATTIDNLITSCEPCNSGKGRRIIGDAQPLPDMAGLADAAEDAVKTIRRWRKAHKAHRTAVGTAIEHLLAGRRVCIPESVLDRAISEYGIAEVAFAVDATSARVDPYDFKAQTSYMFAVLRNRRLQQVEPAPMPTVIKPAPTTTDGCLFGFCERCWNTPTHATDDDDLIGCVEYDEEGEMSACIHLIKACGGWERKELIVCMSDMVGYWRLGAESLIQFVTLEHESAYYIGRKAGIASMKGGDS
jgi:hypothetical protein